ncbi:MAG: hypothetical protein SFX73_34880 [Kofleriaceae bacterium]|nr:hypothetical protein [Kofleriaceae bacterium]
MIRFLPLPFVVLAACAGSLQSSRGNCRLDDALEAPRDALANPHEAARARPVGAPFRNHYAVESVGPARHHFTVWYARNEWVRARLAVVRDSGGKLHITTESSWWGGPAIPPDRPAAPPPPEVAPLVRQLGAEVRGRCRSTRGWRIAYEGMFRSVKVHELIQHNKEGRNSGWFATVTYAVDEKLTKLGHPAEAMSGFGWPRLGAPLNWIRFRPERDGAELLLAATPPPALAAEILAAARAVVAGTPAAPPAPSETTLLPAGFEQRLKATINLYGRGPNQQDKQLVFELPLSDAVFRGTSQSTAQVTLGRTTFTATATLVSSRAPARSEAAIDESFDGTLTFRMTDHRGHTWERSFAATGPLYVEGGAVVAPTGLVLPGGSSPSPEHDALAMRWSGDGEFTSFDSYVDTNVFSDPRPTP